MHLHHQSQSAYPMHKTLLQNFLYYLTEREEHNIILHNIAVPSAESGSERKFRDISCSKVQ